jgi:hypothetical protein
VVGQTFQLARCGCTLGVTSQTSSEIFQFVWHRNIRNLHHKCIMI